MGADKATLIVAGEPLAARAARVLRTVCAPVIEVGAGVTELPSVREEPAGAGPLAALLAGVDALGVDGPVLVLGCDLPFVDHGRAAAAWPDGPGPAASCRWLTAARSTSARALVRRGADRRGARRSCRAGPRCRCWLASTPSSSRAVTTSPTSTHPAISDASAWLSRLPHVALSESPVRRAITDVQVGSFDERTGMRRRPDQVVTEEPMEIRVGGPDEEPAPFAVTMRTPGQRLRAGGRAVPHGGAGRTPTDDLDSLAYCLGRRGRAALQRRDRAAALSRRSDEVREPSLSCPTRRAASAARPRSTRSSSAVSRRSDGPERRGQRGARVCPSALAEHQRIFDKTGGLHAAARFSADRTAARRAGRRRPPQRARQAHRPRAPRRRAPARRRGAARVGPALVRARAEGGGRRDRGVVRGVGAVEPGGRSGRAVRPDRRRVPARRPLQRVHAPRPHRSSRPDGTPAATEGARARRWRPASRAVGRAGGPTASASRSRTTTARSRETVWENRRNLPWAWRILRKGVCDGCALGVAGFHDWTITRRAPLHDPPRAAEGQHRARRSTTPRSPTSARSSGATAASSASSAASHTRWSGAAATPGSRACRGTRRSSSSPSGSGPPTPDRVGLYLTARGITNEVYYVAQKAARAIGTNNVDNAARVCHAPSTAALKETIGVAATTCSYRDVIESDLIVLFGADVANAQPVFMKYLYLAKKRGAKVAVVNPLREPGLERYWVPSNVESAMFGTKITDEFFPVHTGGDVAFVNGVLKELLADRRRRPRLRDRAHERLRRAARRARGRVVRRARAASGATPRRHGALRAAVRAARSRRCWCGRWASPSTSTASTTCARS